MRKLLFRGSLLLVLVGLVAWFAWVSQPAARHPDLAAKLLGEQATIWQAQQSLYAHDSRVNSYLDRSLTTQWRGAGSSDPSTQTLAELARHNPGKQVDLSTARLEKALTDFEPIASSLIRVSDLPVWVWESDLPRRLRAPDYRGIVTVARAMMGRAELQIKRAEFSQALKDVLAVRRFARAIGVGDLTGMGLSAAAQIQWASHLELIRLLQNPRIYSTPELTKAAEQIQATALKMEQVGRAARMEVLCYHQSASEPEGLAQLVSIRTRTPRDYSVNWAARLPGLVSRELRLYDNDFLESLPYWDGGTQEAPTQRTSHTAQEDFDGQESFLSPVSLHQMWYIRRQILKAQAWSSAEQILIALELFRRRHGAYPKALKELALTPEVCFNPLDRWNRILYNGEGNVPELVIPISSEYAALLHGEDREDYRIDRDGVHMVQLLGANPEPDSLPRVKSGHQDGKTYLPSFKKAGGSIKTLPSPD